VTVLFVGAVVRALREEILFHDGRIENDRFPEYLVLRFSDLPPIRDERFSAS